MAKLVRPYDFDTDAADPYNKLLREAVSRDTASTVSSSPGLTRQAMGGKPGGGTVMMGGGGPRITPQIKAGQDKLTDMGKAYDVPGIESLMQTMTSPKSQAMAGAALTDFGAQKKAMSNQQAENEQILSAITEKTRNYQEGLQEAEVDMEKTTERMSERWENVEAKADEYVQNTYDRNVEMFDRLDTLSDELTESRNSAKAHDMQVAIQSTIGAMTRQEKDIAWRYGKDSAEYQAFKGQQHQSLAVMSSNIAAKYQQFAEQAAQLRQQLTAEVGTKMAMYSNFAEQNALETAKLRANSEIQWELKLSQQKVALRQLDLAGEENLSKWYNAMPELTMNYSGLTALLANMASGRSYASVSAGGVSGSDGGGRVGQEGSSDGSSSGGTASAKTKSDSSTGGSRPSAAERRATASDRTIEVNRRRQAAAGARTKDTRERIITRPAGDMPNRYSNQYA